MTEIEFKTGRYIVELENNHHYILIDTFTGSTYYTPAKDDAISLANKLNRYEEKLHPQKKTCENCRYCEYHYLQQENYCEYHNKPVLITDNCTNWIKEEL